MLEPAYILAIDQGTTSTRCIIFDREARIVASNQREHRQHYPRPGWVEHDPRELWTRTREVIAGAMAEARVSPARLAAIGITNQRETAMLWDRRTGDPLHNAIVWQDTRTVGMVAELARQGGQDRFRSRTGLPLATYFSGTKFRWLLDHVPAVREAAARGDALLGTVDSYLAWWLTGGPAGGRHITDVTNASRTMLMDLATLQWDDELLEVFGVPRAALPEIRSSSEHYGVATGALAGVPLAGILGDQQAALVGQTCFAVGEAKNTYGTGNFLLLNTGQTPVASTSGLLTTVAYQFGASKPCYALEGSIAITGALVQWLRDNLGLIASADEIEPLARTVADNGGAYFVPAFAGLFAPHWRADARGVLVGLTGYITKGHIARAALEATAYQTRDIAEAMERDSGVHLASLKVDGGMVRNDLLMQFQADLLGVPVVSASVSETTALGAAYAAGLATGFWPSLDALRSNWRAGRAWSPSMPVEMRGKLYRGWQRAVVRSLEWVENVE